MKQYIYNVTDARLVITFSVHAKENLLITDLRLVIIPLTLKISSPQTPKQRSRWSHHVWVARPLYSSLNCRYCIYFYKIFRLLRLDLGVCECVCNLRLFFLILYVLRLLKDTERGVTGGPGSRR